MTNHIGSHCTYCGEVFVAQEEIPALAHTEGEPVEITAPTETTPGAAMVCCETCHGISRMEEIPALGPARVPGDCDDDGSVDSVDLLLLLQYLSGWDVEINLLNADVNGDGNVDISDPVLILQ